MAQVPGAAAAHDLPLVDILPTAEVSQLHTLSTWAKPDAVPSAETPARVIANPPCAQTGTMLMLPSLGHETSRFGYRADPLGAGWRLHAGIDLAAPMGSPVVAAGRGAVLRAGLAQGYGNLVIIDHGQGLTTRYAHLERSLVHAGQDIAPGQEIGLVGATGHATGSHLHFEIRLGGHAIDPEHARVVDHATLWCPDPADSTPLMGPILGEVMARSGWTEPARDGVLPTLVLR